MSENHPAGDRNRVGPLGSVLVCFLSTLTHSFCLSPENKVLDNQVYFLIDVPVKGNMKNKNRAKHFSALHFNPRLVSF